MDGPTVNRLRQQHSRRVEFPTPDGVLCAKQWLRYEWQRAGLTLRSANATCGVANAATRKYLTQDWLWYLPPPQMMQRHSRRRRTRPTRLRSRDRRTLRPTRRQKTRLRKDGRRLHRQHHGVTDASAPRPSSPDFGPPAHDPKTKPTERVKEVLHALPGCFGSRTNPARTPTETPRTASHKAERRVLAAGARTQVRPDLRSWLLRVQNPVPARSKILKFAFRESLLRAS